MPGRADGFLTSAGPDGGDPGPVPREGEVRYPSFSMISSDTL
jgi:hypothetical protein